MAVPAELLSCDQWVRWRVEPRRPGEQPTKIPFRPIGSGRARVDDPRTWGRFATAAAWLAVGDWAGLGFVFADSGGLVGIDLDGCRNRDTGEIAAWAVPILERFRSTYAEISPSGRGVKIIARGRLATDRSGKRVSLPGDHCGIEAYQRSRFFAVTGQAVAGHPSSVAICQESIDWLWAEHLKPRPSVHRSAGPAVVYHAPNGTLSRAKKRAAAYLERLPAAIQGKDGSKAAFRAACELYRFGLSDGDARDLFERYNGRCQPPWSDDEIDHKLQDAREEVEDRGEFGVHLQDDDANSNSPKVERRSVTPGTIVRAGDRNNFGSVVADNGSSCTVKFTSEDGNTATKELSKRELSLQDGTPLETGASPPACEIELISSSAFASTEYRQKYLIKQILVADQPAIVGGRSKTMKTSLLVDLALSLGAGVPFLGRFEAEQATVAILSGETGAFTLRETALRIAAAKGIKLADAAVFWGFQLPQLARDDDLRTLEQSLLDRSIEVVIIDPAYLCLLAGDIQGARSSDVFTMGPLLLRLSTMGARAGCTIVLAHHCRKNSPQEQFTPPDLEELSMAGFAEWARQWLLLGRRETYEQGSGLHKLWLNVGGSAGHSGCYAVDIDEGVLQEDFCGRHWVVSVAGASDARRDAKRERENRRAQEQEEREEEYTRRLLAAMRNHPAGETKTVLAEQAGLNSKNFAIAIRNLLGDGRAQGCEIRKNEKPYQAYRPTGR